MITDPRIRFTSCAGVGGIGGDGCNYTAHDERHKYKWQLIGGFGISKPESASTGRKRAGSQTSGTQAQVGVQVSGEVSKGPIAGPATTLPAIPPGIPSAASKKKVSGYLEHLAWDNTLWRAALAEDGASFIVVRNGQTSIANGLHILDWHGEPWIVTVENHNTFVYSPPDPSAIPARPTFRVGAMQYLDWFSTPCEVKFKEFIIAPVTKLSNGGHGGQGGPGGAAGAGAPGGDGGNLSIATVNPALLLNVYTESFGGSGGLAGLPGPGGKGTNHFFRFFFRFFFWGIRPTFIFRTPFTPQILSIQRSNIKRSNFFKFFDCNVSRERR